MEVRANAFAASFLMPAEGVRGYVNALSKGLGSRTRADTFDKEAVTRVEGRKRVDTQNADSGPCRSVIPFHADHRFQGMPITDSGACRSPGSERVGALENLL